MSLAGCSLLAEKLYKDVKCPKPRAKTRQESKNCFFSFNSQYKENMRLIIIKNGTARLKTAKNEKVFGGTKGNA